MFLHTRPVVDEDGNVQGLCRARARAEKKTLAAAETGMATPEVDSRANYLGTTVRRDYLPLLKILSTTSLDAMLTSYVRNSWPEFQKFWKVPVLKHQKSHSGCLK